MGIVRVSGVGASKAATVSADVSSACRLSPTSVAAGQLRRSVGGRIGACRRAGPSKRKPPTYCGSPFDRARTSVQQCFYEGGAMPQHQHDHDHTESLSLHARDAFPSSRKLVVLQHRPERRFPLLEKGVCFPFHVPAATEPSPLSLRVVASL